MIQIESGNLRAIERALKDTPKRIPVVLSHTLNAAAASGKTEIARDVSKETNVKVSTIKRMLPVHRSNKNDLAAAIRINPFAPTVIEIDPDPEQSTEGVTYRLKGRKREQIEHGFVATMANGHIGVFCRSYLQVKGGDYREPQSPGDPRWAAEYVRRKAYFAKRREGRLKIIEQRGPSIATVVIDNYPGQYQPLIKRVLGEQVPKQINRELQRQANAANRANR
ncbi:MAG: phage tail protein [Sedimentisphaerales bacterium]|nr:phage tail protein [Sedimentisphaerales bacterium]